MADPLPPSGGSQKSGEDDPEAQLSAADDLEASHATWRLMRSVVLASLLTCFLIFHGNIWVYYEKPWAGVDVFLRAEMAVAGLTFAMLCLSLVAAIAASAAVQSGRHPTLEKLFSRMRSLWSVPSMARVFSTILLLGYLLFLIVLLVVFLMTSGGEISWRTWLLLVCLLALLSFFYVGVVGAVGVGVFLLEEGEGAVEALRRAMELVEEEKVLGLIIFFFSLVVIPMMFAGAWMPEPVLINGAWMLGAGGMVGYAGVLLQI